ncbi:hypothetical protein JCM15765_19140 [Paradesulfitobacterium aromaticivorans]
MPYKSYNNINCKLYTINGMIEKKLALRIQRVGGWCKPNPKTKVYTSGLELIPPEEATLLLEEMAL